MIHRAKAGAALAADDHPLDAAQVERAEVLEQRLYRQEPHQRGAGAQRIEAPQGFPVLELAPNQMRSVHGPGQLAARFSAARGRLMARPRPRNTLLAEAVLPC